jgi:redox-sensitive bicupin YhaK (pirin superfamily)
MTAGRGVVHSERTPEDLRGRSRTVHGLQLWAALPQADEEAEAAFVHTPAADLPVWRGPGTTARVLIGSLFGCRSPVATFAATLYADVAAEAGAELLLPALAPGTERAVYSVDRPLAIDGDALPPATLGVLAPDVDATVVAPQGARFVILGGAPLDGPRFIVWNFVSSSRERIERAKAAWQAQTMGKVPGETEWIPLP